MKTFKVLCFLLIVLSVRCNPLLKPIKKSAETSNANPSAVLDTDQQDEFTTILSSDPDPADETGVTEPTSTPELDTETATEVTELVTESPTDIDYPPTTPESDADDITEANSSSPSSTKPNASSKSKETSSPKADAKTKTSQVTKSKLTFDDVHPPVNKQKPGGPNPNSESQIGLGNGFAGFGIPGAPFQLNPSPVLTGSGQNGFNNFPLSGGNPTFIELPFQDNFNNRHPVSGLPGGLQPLPVSSNGEVIPGFFNVEPQNHGLEVPVTAGVVVNPNVPQNVGVLGVPTTGPFDFGRPFGNPTNEFGDTPVIVAQQPFTPGSPGILQGTTPRPPIFPDSRPGTQRPISPKPGSSPPLFLNPNDGSNFPRPTNPRPFPLGPTSPRPFSPGPTNPPPLFLNPVSPNPPSRPSVFFGPPGSNPFIPEDRIPFLSNPNDPDDPTSIFLNSVGDTDSRPSTPARPSVLFLNPEGDRPPPRAPPSVFPNSRPATTPLFPLGPTTPGSPLFPQLTTPAFPFFPQPTSPSPFLPRPTPTPFLPRPTTQPPIFPQPTTPSSLLPRPTPTPFLPRPTPTPFLPRPTPTPFLPRPTPTPFSPRPTTPQSFSPRPGISINSHGNRLTPSTILSRPTLRPPFSPNPVSPKETPPFFPSTTLSPGRFPVRPLKPFNPVSSTARPSIIVSDDRNRPSLVTPVPVTPLKPGYRKGNPPHKSRGPPISLNPPKHNYGEGPAYSYGYAVEDPATGNFQGAEQEKGHDGVVRGSYHLLQPDGKTRVVKYSADDYNGFQANVNYLPPSFK